MMTSPPPAQRRHGQTEFGLQERASSLLHDRQPPTGGCRSSLRGKKERRSARHDAPLRSCLVDGFEAETQWAKCQKGAQVSPCSGATGRTQKPFCTRSTKSQVEDNPPNSFSTHQKRSARAAPDKTGQLPPPPDCGAGVGVPPCCCPPPCWGKGAASPP